MLSEDFFDEEEIDKDHEHSFENKPVWSRIAVVAAGPVFNFLLAWVLAVIVMGGAGYDKPVINYVEKGSPAEEAGLKEGDLIRKFNGEKISLGREIAVELVVNPVSDKEIEIVYERDGDTHTAVITPIYREKYAVGISYSAQSTDEAVIASVTEDGPFAQAGGKKGDIITDINGTAIESSADLYDYITENPFDGTEVSIMVSRDGEKKELTVTPVLGSKGYSMGLSYNTYRYQANALETVRYSFAEIKYQIESVFKSLGMLFQGKLGVKDFTGPVGIVDIIGTTYDSAKTQGAWMTFLNVANITILLSANLGVMNLLPIPGVDGGRLLFLLIEAVFRKPVPKKFEGVVTAVCMLLLMLFAVFIMYQDIMKLL